VYSDVPGGVFNTHGSSFVPLPVAIVSPPHPSSGPYGTRPSGRHCRAVEFGVLPVPAR
jgi:hypothetical protein